MKEVYDGDDWVDLSMGGMKPLVTIAVWRRNKTAWQMAGEKAPRAGPTTMQPYLESAVLLSVDLSEKGGAIRAAIQTVSTKWTSRQ